ncbi:MAG: hypothetical protein AB4368_02070 [Xenococcaceae cyanobacterium]
MSHNQELFTEIIPSEEANLAGGSGRHRRRRPVNTASADATADAFGRNTDTYTFTDAFVRQGHRSSSTSSSYAESY